MWRSNFDAPWERKKEYLIRSLFQDVPPLSPVPEEDESFDSSGSRIHRSPVSAPRARSRSPSPLPPLIIEKEPNRHDEPEQFYKEMEKRVLRIYRKLFIEGKNSVSDISSAGNSDSEDVDTDNTFNFEERITLRLHDSLYEPYSHPEDIEGSMDYVTDNFEEQISSEVHNISNEPSDDLDQISIEKNNERSGLKRTISDQDEDTSASKSKKSKSTKTTSSSTPSPKSTVDDDDSVTDSISSDEDEAEDNTEMTLDNNTPPTDYSEEVLQVTFKADVHRDADYEFVKPPSVVYERAENIVEAINDLEDINDGETTLENNTVSGKSIHHASSDATEIIEEIEDIRAQPIRPSVGSLHNEDHTTSADEITMEEAPRELERHTESVSPHDRDLVSMAYDINVDLLRRSSVEINCGNREEVSRRFRSNSTSSSSDGSSMRNYADADVQTSYDHGIINVEILREMVVGIPRIARLCTCANHSCIR